MSATDQAPETETDSGIWNHHPEVPIPIGGIFRNLLNPLHVAKGILFSWTIAHMPMHPAFLAEVPYVTGVIELEEGVRMVSLVRGAVMEDLELDMPVKVEFERVTDDFTLPYFVPA